MQLPQRKVRGSSVLRACGRGQEKAVCRGSAVARALPSVLRPSPQSLRAHCRDLLLAGVGLGVLAGACAAAGWTPLPCQRAPRCAAGRAAQDCSPAYRAGVLVGIALWARQLCCPGGEYEDEWGMDECMLDAQTLEQHKDTVGDLDKELAECLLQARTPRTRPKTNATRRCAACSPGHVVRAQMGLTVDTSSEL